MTIPLHYDAWGFSLALFPADAPETVYRTQSTAMLKSFQRNDNNTLEPCDISLMAYFYSLYSPTYLAVVPDIHIKAVEDYLREKFNGKNAAMVGIALSTEEENSSLFLEELTEEQEDIALDKMRTGVLLNHTTHQFVNLKAAQSPLNCIVMLTMFFDPDLLKTQSIVAIGATVGEWAFDLLEACDSAPDGYAEIYPKFSLAENQ